MPSREANPRMGSLGKCFYAVTEKEHNVDIVLGIMGR